MQLSLTVNSEPRSRRSSNYQPTELRADPLENPALSLIDPRAWSAVFGFGGLSAAGVTVTAEKMLGIPAVWCAVNFLSNTIASLPLGTFKRDGLNVIPAPDHALADLVGAQPNEDLLTSFQWRKQMMTGILTEPGRAYTFIERNQAGKVMNLWPLDPNGMSIRRVNGRKIYEYREGSQAPKTYQAAEIIDLAWMIRPDGITHHSPVSLFKDSFGLSIALEQYAGKLFQNGGIPPLALQGPMPSSPAGVSRASEDVKESLKSAQREQRNVVVLPNGYELKPIGFDPDKGQMTDSRLFQVQESARIYDLPPVFLHDLSRASFANMEQQDLSLIKHTILHWTTMIAQELNVKLTPRRSKTFLDFDLTPLGRGSFLDRMRALSAAVQAASRTPNEARAMDNLPPKPGGDRLYMNGALVPIDMEKADPSAAPPLAFDEGSTDADAEPQA